MENSHRKRCKRFNDAGHAHALTFSCFRRQPFLGKDRSRQWLVDAIDRARDKHGFHLWAWVIMPEHAHIFLWPPQPTYSISDILSSIKQSVAKRALIFVKRNAPEFLGRMEDRQPNGRVSHRFWQRGGGFDRNLTEPTTAWSEIDYMHGNPLRRGLCQRPTDWKWSSAREHAEPGSGVLSLNLDSLPRTIEG